MHGEKQRLTSANCATMSQTHCRDLNSCQPSRRSANSRSPGPPCPPRGARDVSTSTADAPNVAASIPTAQPAPTATMRTPDIAAPARLAEFSDSRISAVPDWSSATSTICGMSAREAGMNRAFAAPFSAESPVSKPIGAYPEMKSAATAPCAANASRSDVTIIRYRGNRSASAPPKIRNTICAIDRPASTVPSLAAEPPGCPSTPNASATGAIDVPSSETPRARKIWRNVCSRNIPRSRFMTPEYAAGLTGGKRRKRQEITHTNSGERIAAPGRFKECKTKYDTPFNRQIALYHGYRRRVGPSPARPGSAAVGRVVRGEQAGCGVVGVGRGRHAKRLEQLVEVEPDLGRERPERADAPGRGSLRLRGHAGRLRPAGLDAVASVEHVADHGRRRHVLADLHGRRDVLGHVDHQPRIPAIAQLVGNPPAARPAAGITGRAGDDAVAQSVDRTRPGEVDALVDALEDQVGDAAERVEVAGRDGGADDLGLLGGPERGGKLQAELIGLGHPA